jgi:8-oxo-dGTP pyrophosphatase MutT (NUDIX family)
MEGCSLRKRPSSRLLILDSANRVLLFRFEHKTGPLAGQSFWATPGGGLEDHESFADAAIRELQEETGMVVSEIGEPVARREFTMVMPDGEHVLADEQFYVIRAPDQKISTEGWTPLEVDVMADYKWWSANEILASEDTIWPADLHGLLPDLG